MKLSENFTLEEFTKSETAEKYNETNSPTDQHLKVLKHTCEYCLEKLRSLLNKNFVGTKYKGKLVAKVALKITSGYRSKKVNELLRKEGYNPSETSQHCTGEAADLEAILIFRDGYRAALPYNELYSLIKLWVRLNALSVDQCIKEKQGSATWVHVSHSAWGASRDRRQFKIFDGIRYIPD